MSKRNNIINHICTLLKKNTVFTGNVFSSKVSVIDIETLPCVLVSIPQESAEVFAQATRLELKKSANLAIQIIVDSTEETESELHDMAALIEGLILQDDSLGDQVSRVSLEGIEFEVNLEGERPIGTATMKFVVTYFEMVLSEQEKARPLRGYSISLST
jgi:hypothetical protein